jgi:hypothetical protein
MHFPNWGDHIEDVFLYNLLYILVDHYIDDINMDNETKTTAIKQMYILVNDPLEYKSMNLVDPLLKTTAKVYYKLLTRCPKCKDSIIKLFTSEVNGLYIQKNSTCTRDIYYDIALKKGGYTMEVLQHIVGNEDEKIAKATYQIGEIMQLIDDSLDVISDKNNKINTIATRDLSINGNLDELWIDIINRVNNIDSNFTVFKLLYSFFSIYIPDRNKNNYSTQIYTFANKYNLFDFDATSLLVDYIMNELFAIDLLTDVSIN